VIERHNRRERLGELIQAYARRLQHHACDAPYNWFNFYDFWQADDPNHARTAPALAPTGDAPTAVDGAAAVRRRLQLRGGD